MPTPSVINQYQYSAAINRRYWDSKYWADNFQVQPVTSKVAGGAATGTAGDNNVLFTSFGQYEWFVIGTQTILAPSLDTFGLNLVQDVTAGDGLELCMGTQAISPMAFLVNATASSSNPNPSPAFFGQMKIKVATVAGGNPLIFGFRQAGAFNATLTSYANYAAIGLVGGAGKIQTVTQLSSGGQITTDSTQTGVNAAESQFAVYVDASGNVTYQYNYVAPTVTVAYQFPANTTVVPFIRFTEGGTTTTQASCNSLQIGYQS